MDTERDPRHYPQPGDILYKPRGVLLGQEIGSGRAELGWAGHQLGRSRHGTTRQGSGAQESK